jgi:hypothetical protein
MKISPVGAELFHADGQTGRPRDRQTTMTELIVSFSTFVNACTKTIRKCTVQLSSSVGIATDYGLDCPGIESRLRRDFPPVHTGPGSHSASCTMGTGSFPGVKCSRGVLLTTHPLLAPRSWKSRLYLYPPLGHNPACNEVTSPLPYGTAKKRYLQEKSYPTCVRLHSSHTELINV